jgi:hypothetical protein
MDLSVHTVSQYHNYYSVQRSRSFNNKAKRQASVCLLGLVKNNQSITPPTTGGSISLRRNYFRVRSNTLFFHPPFQSLHHTVPCTRVDLQYRLVTRSIPLQYPHAGLCTARTYTTSYRSLS